MFRFLLSLLLLALLGAPARADDATATALHLLDYIAVDYGSAVAEGGQVRSADEYKEMREFATETRRLLQALPERPERAALLSQADQLLRGVTTRADAARVADQARALRWAVIRAYDVATTPRRPPELARAAALYAGQCAACHGAMGHGDGPAGRQLDPHPSDFHEPARMAQRSVFGLYNTISLGVKGTAMTAYTQLDNDERWALALFVSNFASDETMRARGRELWESGQGREVYTGLEPVLTLSAQEVRSRHGEAAVAIQHYLRSAPQALAGTRPQPLAHALEEMALSLTQYRGGNPEAAARHAIQAYLEGFELVESSLRTVDADLMLAIERDMMAYRGLVQARAPLAQVEALNLRLQAALGQARERLDGAELSPTTAFVSALLILLREGVEAILVVAAMLAFTRRAGRDDARRWVHAGWISALALGLLTWVVSTRLVSISGAHREITEGVTALLAAAMLLYVGYWMHSKSHSQAWQKYIGSRMSGALAAGTVHTLALISFLAVYREAFETVLFLQALSTQAGPAGHGALFAGLGTGALLLLALAWVILRASVRLPVGLFFSVSGLALIVLAVVFTGQGVAALQEAGYVGAHAVPFFRLPLLGIYPTAQSLLAQAGMSALSALVLWWSARTARAQTSPPRA